MDEQQVAIIQMDQDILAAAVDSGDTPPGGARFESGTRFGQSEALRPIRLHIEDFQADDVDTQVPSDDFTSGSSGTASG